MSEKRVEKGGEIVERVSPRFDRVDAEDEEIRVGQWFVRDGEDLCCVTAVGSNYAATNGPECNYVRVHLDEFWERCVPEPRAREIIQERVQARQTKVSELIEEANRLTQQLFVGTHDALPSSDTQALAKINENVDPNAYKIALRKAKDHTLPEIFRKIEQEHRRIGTLMEAELLPMQGELLVMKQAIQSIENRIFSIDLYAGLSEQVVHVAEGEPAAFNEKIHIMQRRLYMDEESLLDYKAGGMEFKNLGAFDAWLAKPDNMNRILPHPRCVVAFRVRRTIKKRDGAEYTASLLGAFIRIRLEERDTKTFMYMRNGENLYRMNTRIDFPERLFGDDALNLLEPVWALMSNTMVRSIITERDYLDRLEAHEEAVRRTEAFDAEHPGYDYWMPPSRDEDERRTWNEMREERSKATEGLDDNIRRGKYVRFDRNTVYFDEIKEYVEKQAKEQNRIAVIMQGMLDRSPVFHPHPPAELWTAEGFNATLELVHDASRALNPSEEPPDFMAYWKECNASIQTGSVVMGQQKHWRKYMIDKMEADGRRSFKGWDHTPRIPFGNPGPGNIARVEHFQPRARKCRFTWLREKRKKWWEKTPSSFTIEADKVFNLDGYTPGDFLKFFADPRTRVDYLKWAPYLLTAEDYHAGKVEPQEPGTG